MVSSVEDDSYCCKVTRLAAAYDLSSVEDELIEMHEDGASTRTLETHFNTAVVEAALESVEEGIVADPEGIYEVLAGEDVSPRRRITIEDGLQSIGIDPDDLAGDFVSHVTLWTHLKDHLSRDTGNERLIDVDEARETIDRARSREESHIENTLSRLDERADFEATDVETTVSIRVICRVCGTSYRLAEFLENGGCQCDTESA